MDCQGQIGSNEVRVFQRSKDGKSPAETRFDNRIYSLSVTNSIFHQGDRFSPERML